MDQDNQTDLHENNTQMDDARRREILIPFILIAVSFGIFFAAVVCLAIAEPASLSRLSDSIVTLFTVLMTVALLVGFALNLLIISQITKLRRTLRMKLEAAIDTIHETEEVVLDALNNLSEPLIGLIAKYNAVLRVFGRSRERAKSKDAAHWET